MRRKNLRKCVLKEMSEGLTRKKAVEICKIKTKKDGKNNMSK